MDAIVLVLAEEMRGRDVTVNAVAPGPTATALFLDGKDEETVDRMAKPNPIERLGTPTTSPRSCRITALLTPAGERDHLTCGLSSCHSVPLCPTAHGPQNPASMLAKPFAVRSWRKELPPSVLDQTVPPFPASHIVR